jgi:UDP-glucose 4-epimerase
MKEKVLVTGGLGFIGSHTVDLLSWRDYEVGVVDLKDSRKVDYANPRAEYFQCDISLPRALAKIFEKLTPTYVIHCAALARIQPSFNDPDHYFKTNVEGTRNVLALARQYRVKRVVYSASSSAYGEVTPPFKEDVLLPPQALSPYASTKRMGEMLMKDMGKLTGGPETVCLRYFNVYGPRQATLADGPYATVVGIFLSQKQEGKPLTIVAPGRQRRDFTHVFDVREANLLAMISKKVGNAEIINIGTGKSYSVLQVASLVLGKPCSFDLFTTKDCLLVPERRGEVFATRADISKAKALLGWWPSISLESGIKLC